MCIGVTEDTKQEGTANDLEDGSRLISETRELGREHQLIRTNWEVLHSRIK